MPWSTLQAALEERVETGTRTADRFRSRGERYIADTLDDYGIPFIYEPKVTVRDNSRIRTLRPDFYLPEFNVFIEYYGRVGNQDYDIRTALKKETYAANNLHVISLYPWDLIEDWPNYLFERLPLPPNHYPLKSTNRQYNPEQSKPRNGIRSSPTSRYQHTPRSSYCRWPYFNQHYKNRVKDTRPTNDKK